MMSLAMLFIIRVNIKFNRRLTLVRLRVRIKIALLKRVNLNLRKYYQNWNKKDSR